MKSILVITTALLLSPSLHAESLYVKFYKDSDFQGKELSASSNIPSLEYFDMDKKISSIQIPENVSIEIFSKPGFEGEHVKILGGKEISFLDDITPDFLWNDNISSIKITANTTKANEAKQRAINAQIPFDLIVKEQQDSKGYNHFTVKNGNVGYGDYGYTFNLNLNKNEGVPNGISFYEYVFSKNGSRYYGLNPTLVHSFNYPQLFDIMDKNQDIKYATNAYSSIGQTIQIVAEVSYPGNINRVFRSNAITLKAQ